MSRRARIGLVLALVGSGVSLPAGGARAAAPEVSVGAPGGLAVDDAGNVYVSDRAAGTVIVVTPVGRSATVATGITGAGDIDVAGCELVVALPQTVRRVPLGLSGKLVDTDGSTPLANVAVLARGTGGMHSSTVRTDAGGRFTLSLEAFPCEVKDEQAEVVLVFTTPGTSMTPSRTASARRVLDVGPTTRRRVHTLVQVTLPPEEAP